MKTWKRNKFLLLYWTYVFWFVVGTSSDRYQTKKHVSFYKIKSLFRTIYILETPKHNLIQDRSYETEWDSLK